MKFSHFKIMVTAFLFFFISFILFAVDNGSGNKKNEKISINLTKKEKAWLKVHKTISVIALDNGAPIQFYNSSGEYRGISADYLNLLAKKIGFNYTVIKADSLAESLHLIRNKKADLIAAVTPTTERFKYMDFSTPYLEMNPVIIIRKGDNDNLSLDSLNNHKVAIVKNSATSVFIKYNYPNIKIISVPTTYAGLTLVSTGGVDAFVSNMLETSYYIQSEGITNLKVAAKTDYVTRMTFGVSKDCIILASIFNKGLESISDKEKKVLLSHWTSFSSSVVYGEGFWLMLLIIGGALFVIFIFIILWNMSLKKQVISRTKELVIELAERQKAEKEITKYRDHLEELVKDRTASLNETNEKLVKEINVRTKVEKDLSIAKENAVNANKAKSVFLANMSHEIRTPMNVILGFSQLLCRDDALTGEQRMNLKTIDRSGKHLLNLIDNILEMTKIEAGKLILNEEVFDLHMLMSDLEIIFNVKALHKKVTFSVKYPSSIPRYLKGDTGKIRQVLVNLLGNAVKYTEKGFVQLELQSIADFKDSIMLKFIVDDTGPGIASEEEGKLFSSFSQTATGIKEGKGTGLGLAISQKYINLMGSKIEFDNKQNKGAKFYFTLDLKKGNTDEIVNSVLDIPRKVKGLVATSISKYKIFICEDEKANRDLLTKLLVSVGFEVDTAPNGKECLEKIAISSPDLLLLDLRMPLLNGYDTIKKLREDVKFNNLPVFAITANVFDEDKVKVIKAGFDEFLGKPIDEDILLGLIGVYLGVEYIYYKTPHINDLVGSKIIKEFGLNLKNISFEIRMKLINLIEEADYDGILEELTKLKSVNREFADKLILMTNDFNYQHMLEILKN
jgi:signal transduction histidine kinase/CheY-like chemotaxis protein